MSKRRTTLCLTLTILLMATVAWTYDHYRTNTAAAENAARDLHACRRLSSSIENLRRLPQSAASQENLAAEVTGLVEQAAKTAGTPANCLARIAPDQPRRLGDTVFKEKPTHVLLKQVTLEQFLRLLESVQAANRGLGIRSVSLRAPQPEDIGPYWNAEFTVSLLIYDPPKRN